MSDLLPWDHDKPLSLRQLLKNVSKMVYIVRKGKNLRVVYLSFFSLKKKVYALGEHSFIKQFSFG
jgi:hypothetical protein